MITLCIHCLRPIKELQATILPPSAALPAPDAKKPRTFTVKVQRLHAAFVQSSGKAELMLDVITDEPGVTPDDVQAADFFSCVHCGDVLNRQIHCITIKGTEIIPVSEGISNDDPEVPKGYVMVAMMGASNRFDVRSYQEVRAACHGLIKFNDYQKSNGPGSAQENFEWDH